LKAAMGGMSYALHLCCGPRCLDALAISPKNREYLWQFGGIGNTANADGRLPQAP
jgi:hypothetical protein